MIERVAKLYYDHGLTHQEIGDMLGLSRIKVTRLLAEARASGIVEITVHTDSSPFVDLELELIQRYKLHSAWVAPALAQFPERADQAIARTAADALTSMIAKRSVVAMGLSNMVGIVSSGLPKQPLGGEYVPVSGSLAGPSDGSSPAEHTLRFAAQFGGQAYQLPATMLAPTAVAARMTLESPQISETLSKAARADLLIAGLGSLNGDAGILFHSLSQAQRKELLDLGAVGDIAGRYFDASGVAVASAVDDRIIGLSLEEIIAIPERLAVVRGDQRLPVTRAALESGIITSIVTDSDFARALLS